MFGRYLSSDRRFHRYLEERNVAPGMKDGEEKMYYIRNGMMNQQRLCVWKEVLLIGSKWNSNGPTTVLVNLLSLRHNSVIGIETKDISSVRWRNERERFLLIELLLSRLYEYKKLMWKGCVFVQRTEYQIQNTYGCTLVILSSWDKFFLSAPIKTTTSSITWKQLNSRPCEL